MCLEFDDLVAQYNPIDIGNGFPNYNPPKHLLDALRDVTANDTSWRLHQYADFRGDPRLRRAIAKLSEPLIKRHIDADREVLVTIGAIQALDLVTKSFVNPGDEVIFFSPFFVQYEQIIRLEGGVPILVPLKTLNGQKPREANDLSFDRKELEAAFNNRTKMIWVNNPNNPTGKSFTEEELTFIGQLCEKHDVIIISDEVGQWYNYGGQPHVRLASLPGMWKRTITVVSGGKTFSNIGWRIGWAFGPEELLWGLAVGLSASVLAVPTPTQVAFAMALEVEIERLNTNQSYFSWLSTESMAKRDRFLKILNEMGVDAIKPNAGYFIVTNFTNIVNRIDLSLEKDTRTGFQLALWLIRQKGLSAFPGNLFYPTDQKDDSEFVLRMCFIKTDALIDKIEGILKNTFAVKANSS
ncbi:unnamed protein product [Medioppia subpectinata]|uniref:Aminotransferase class I/classII large domain-containing protein n=1 Tax=Medioppia subpectinata TaxID=1979941 RepID=A0A7R9PTV0_9ACAR|nr:unnamed protein product [Medioppia subpectinata]CAG2101051.1 unnamed protein product [Medioppia subpectinata]